jgi:hypothetical protein
MAAEALIPVNGCWVRRRDTKGQPGCVLEHRKVDEGIEIKVSWNSSNQEWIPLADLKCGFQRDWAAQDVPISATRKSLGQGKIISRRELGGRE